MARSSGRPTKDTPERRERILTALRAGNTRGAASRFGGIDQSTFERWCHRHTDFAEAVEKAEADAEVGHVANIAREAKAGNWTASAWWLERRRPKDWGRTVKVDIEAHIRTAAEELGLDPDEAVEEAARLLRTVRNGPTR